MAADDREVIRLVGLKELSRSLRQVEAGLQKEIGRAFKRAADKVAQDARRRVPKRSGKLAGSIRPFGTQKKAGVRMGRSSVPYAGPIEFGGYPASRPFVPKGRYIYPSFKESMPVVQRDLAKELEGLIKRAGLS